MRLTSTLLLFALVLLSFGCEDEVSYFGPTIEDQFVKFTIDGDAQTFQALPTETIYYSDGVDRTDNMLRVDDTDPSANFLTITRTNTSGETTLTIIAEAIPLVKTPTGYRLVDGRSSFPAKISIRDQEMSGSIYCPHFEGLTTLDYNATLTLSEFPTDGTPLKGQFAAKASDLDVPALEAGTFNVRVDYAAQ